MEKSKGKFSLAKQYRLNKTYEYRRVYKTGRKIRSASFMLFYLPSETGNSRVGIAIGRKVGISVVRNKLRRKIREILRCYRPFFRFNTDLVLVAHPQAASLSFSEIDLELKKMLEIAHLL